MIRSILKYTTLVIMIAGLVLLLFNAFRTKPIKVDVAYVTRGNMMVTIDEEGKTRISQPYVIATPITGRLARVEFKEGDLVKAKMALARIDPLPLDPRQRKELLARVEAAEAAYAEAKTNVERIRTALEQAQREYKRATMLAAEGLISQQNLEVAENTEATKLKEFEAAEYSAEKAASEIKIAKANLIAFEPLSDSTKSIYIYSPLNGRVLRVLEKSEHVITAGTPILELGDPGQLEVVIDVLSSDAVKIRPNAPIIIEDWGGEKPLQARVKIVEPSAFTKVSALGIEEQRVNVIAEFIGSSGNLGNGYRVAAKIVLWESKNVLKVPLSALFRYEQNWALFTIKESKARRCEVRIDHRNANEVEILQGLSENTKIILYPPSQLEDNFPVTTE